MWMPTLLLSWVLSGCSGSRDAANPVVASYGTNNITFQQLQNQLRKSSNPDSTSDQAYEEFLRRYLNFRLKVSEAERLGIDRDSAQVAELTAYKSQLGRPYLLERDVLRPLTKTQFDRSKEVIKVRHILVRVTGPDTTAAYNKMKTLRDSVLAGADFGKVAFNNSDDVSAKKNYGELPLIVAGKFVNAFEDLCWKTPVGKISTIARSPEWGYHLVQVLERKTSAPAVRSSQIFIRPQGNTAADSTAAFQKAQSILDRARAGEAFNVLAREYADDPYLKQNEGDIGFREMGELIEPLNTKLFELKNIGDLTPVIKSNLGFHLFKVTDRKKETTYEEAFPELKEQISNAPIFEQKQRAYAQKIRKQVQVSYDKKALENLFFGMPKDSLWLQFQPLSPFRRKHENDVVATFDQKLKVKLADVLDVAMRQRPQPGAYPAAEAMRITEEVLDEKALDAYVLKLDGLDTQFRDLLREYRDGILLFKISEDSLWNRASKDTLALRRYYNAHADRYHWTERTRTFAFQSSKDSLLSVISARLQVGMRAEEVAALFKDQKDVRFESMLFADSTNSIYDRGFALKEGEYTEPLPYLRYKVLLVGGGKLPPRPKTFDEARAEVTNDYQRQLEDQWMNRLMQRYKGRVYPERLRAALALQRKRT